MMGEVECPIKLYGVLAVTQPKPKGREGYLIKLFIWVTIVLYTHWMREMRLLCVSPRIWNWEDAYCLAKITEHEGSISPSRFYR